MLNKCQILFKFSCYKFKKVNVYYTQEMFFLKLRCVYYTCMSYTTNYIYIYIYIYIYRERERERERDSMKKQVISDVFNKLFSKFKLHWILLFGGKIKIYIIFKDHTEICWLIKLHSINFYYVYKKILNLNFYLNFTYIYIYIYIYVHIGVAV